MQVSSLLGFTSVLDNANPGDLILVSSFGSGAGSDVFSYKITDKITSVQHMAPNTSHYLNRAHDVDYAMYMRWRKKIREY